MRLLRNLAQAVVHTMRRGSGARGGSGCKFLTFAANSQKHHRKNAKQTADATEVMARCSSCKPSACNAALTHGALGQWFPTAPRYSKSVWRSRSGVCWCAGWLRRCRVLQRSSNFAAITPPGCEFSFYGAVVGACPMQACVPAVACGNVGVSVWGGLGLQECRVRFGGRTRRCNSRGRSANVTDDPATGRGLRQQGVVVVRLALIN